MTSDDLARRIDIAFDGQAMPQTERELAEPSIEARYVIDHFLGRSRSDVASDFLPALYMEDFTYMTPNAVAYYLPVVLKLMLQAPHDFELWTYLSGFLGAARRRYTESLRGLRRTHYEAIAEWAEFLVDAFGGSFGCDPKQAAKLARLYRALAEATTA